MYLKSLFLKNFRSCNDVKVKFQPTITLLVGENNSGKSNVIDALRLATTPLSMRRSRYFEETDISYGRDEAIEITAEFDALTRVQAGHFITALDIETSTAWYTTRYLNDPANPRRASVEHLSGKVASPDPEPKKRDEINHVYLAPLRDAQRELDSSAGNRLSLIMRYLVSEDVQDDFMQRAQAQFLSLESHDLIRETSTQLQEHVTDLTQPLRGQHIGIGFTDLSLIRLMGGLRLKMA
jgi:putative ATP-dependent endonuclease of OLD family